ncbi:unnamed protein product [Adineta steineri]|uniref:ubiquitinyl hydrolase 1 n=1 Tax=Adineta steineri TaxID=433720 RepID=A0A820A9M4_9BILA|nr:unnamed protein product [Adineta steineri]
MLPDEVSFKDKNGIWMTRRQLPLSLGYAITVQRSQCMTYNKLVVDLTGINWKPGMFYTISSRTRKLTDIIILAYDQNSFKVSKPAMDEMRRLEIIEKNYPIKIEHYLAAERYIDWCLPNLCEDDQLSLKSSNTTTESSSKRRHLKRVTCQTSNLDTAEATRKPEHLIICEKQEQLFCGRHVLRALSQTLDLFDDDYLKEVAQNIAATEQINRHGEAIQLPNIIMKTPENMIFNLLEHDSNIYVTVQYISDAIEDEITTDNLKTRLWALPDAPADREALVNI